MFNQVIQDAMGKLNSQMGQQMGIDPQKLSVALKQFQMMPGSSFDYGSPGQGQMSDQGAFAAQGMSNMLPQNGQLPSFLQNPFQPQ